MNKVFRRYLFSSFVGLFIIISASVLFYAFGYTFSSYGWRIEKTGFLQIKTKPEKASIYLDGKPHGSWLSSFSSKPQITLTPAKISNIKSGFYDLELRLDGYYTWSKHINIYSGETTYLENVRFFSNNLPEILQTTTINSLTKTSPNRSFGAVLNTDQLFLLDLKDLKIIKTYPVKNYQEKKYISWSPNSRWLIVNGQIIDVNNLMTPPINLNSVDGQFIIARFNTENSTIYYLQAGRLFSYRLTDCRFNSITPVNISNYLTEDWLIKDNYTYLLEQNSSSREWRINILDGSGKSLNTLNLQIISDLSFVNYDNRWINIADTKNHKLYLLPAGPKELTTKLKTLENVDQANWLNNRQLLLSGNSELRLWDSEQDKENLLSRVSRPLINAIWHTDDNYIIYATDKGIYALELDNRGGHHETRLVTGSLINHLSLSNNGQRLFFFGQVAEQTGFYTLKLY